eukprot:9039229-Pyramimonas_sp.AAC.1
MAFGGVTHDGIWRALTGQGVPSSCVDRLDKLRQGQTGAAKTDETSEPFSVRRGARQGGPPSFVVQ